MNIDPTSGSGSLLINIGTSVAKYMNDSNGIKYYAQELKQNTYNLTRMNLIMRGILPSNLFVRNGDTLESDWPYFDESDPERTYTTLHVDAVVSNPPYSQQWDADDRENDPRYKEYGIAPKSVADYAFLLHDLYHVKPDGIMMIVLPHGVLFRGGSEGEIRKNLIEHNNIDAIIGLPPNIFFGTGISTIIMVLRKNKNNSDIQIIDASKGCIKYGKNNVLRACDIKKIVDAIVHREDIDKFSRVVSLEEIRKNNYNLNIPRYVDSSEEGESYDLYASMLGGVPADELKKYDLFWDTFPNLKWKLFHKLNNNYYELVQEDLEKVIHSDLNVKKYIYNFQNIIHSYSNELKEDLIDNMNGIDLGSEEEKISNRLFDYIKEIRLIDKYRAFQILDDFWEKISQDLEIIQNDGFKACTEVEPNMIIRKKNGVDTEVQDGWKGKILSFNIVQNRFFKKQLELIQVKNDRLDEIASSYVDMLAELSEENKMAIDNLLNDNNTAFKFPSIVKRVKEIKKRKKTIEENSVDSKLLIVNDLYLEELSLKVEIKDEFEKLQVKTKDKIESLTTDEVYELLQIKWIKPIEENISNIISEVINDFSRCLRAVSNKYMETFQDLEKKINSTEKDLSIMIDELTGSEFDMKGIEELKFLLSGEDHERK